MFNNTVQAVSNQTMARTLFSNQHVELEGVVFLEFFWMQWPDNIEVRIFNSVCHYDMIIGRDILNALGISMDFMKKEIMWDKTVVLMCSFPHTDEDDLPITQQLLHDFLDEGYNDDDITESEMEMLDDEPQQEEDIQVAEEQEGNKGDKSKVIKESKYEAAELEEVCQNFMHLSLTQQYQLLEVLSRYPTLFNGELKKCSHFQVHLELQANAIPHSGKAYGIPYCHCDGFKNELEYLVQIGVLEKALHSEWLAGTFAQPNKDGHIHWISSFRGLNKHLRQKVYPLPRIGDILAKCTGYQYLSKINISMQYYTFELDKESHNLCTIVIPFGLYRYNQLPMGVSESPDIAQEFMEHLLQDLLEEIVVYIDDVLVTNHS